MRWAAAAALGGAALGSTACGSESALFDDQAGFSARRATDTWTQSPNDQVDMLWVIDNSTSMIGEQALLASGFASFVDKIEQSDVTIDFHLGVITTAFDSGDPQAGVLLGQPSVLTGVDQLEAQFALRAQEEVATVVASPKEKGLAAAAFALSPSMTLAGGPNQGFLRRNAQLLVVFVSDEDDCSDDGRLDQEGPDACYELAERLPPVGDFLMPLWDAKDSRDQVQVGAIVGTEGSACSEVFPGRRYIAAAELTGGLVGDICQTDWSGMLEELGLTAIGIRTRFQLSDAAVPSTLEVEVGGRAVAEGANNGWTYDPATWFLDFHGDAVPPRGATISATYRVDLTITTPPG